MDENVGAILILAVVFLGGLFGGLFIGINADVIITQADIVKSQKLCTNNEGIFSINADNNRSGKVICKDGTEYKISTYNKPIK